MCAAAVWGRPREEGAAGDLLTLECHREMETPDGGKLVEETSAMIKGDRLREAVENV